MCQGLHSTCRMMKLRSNNLRIRRFINTTKKNRKTVKPPEKYHNLQEIVLSCKKSTKNCQASRVSSALFPSAPSPFSRHYNTSCKLAINASLLFYKETPGYEAALSPLTFKDITLISAIVP
jgi:hypothetical protein